MRVRAAVIVAALLLAGAAPYAIAGAGSVSQEDRIELSPGEGVRLRPVDGPWGRIEITVTKATTVRLDLSHDTMDDLTGFTDDGKGIYDEKHFTFLRAEPAGSDRFGGYDDFVYRWWGAPNWSIWPGRDGPQTWSLDADQSLIVLLANNVDGYTVTVTAGENGSEQVQTRPWRLGPREGFGLFLPEPDGQALADNDAARVKHKRTWEVQRSVDDAIVKARKWNLHDGPTAEAGTESDHLAIHSGAPEDEERDPHLTGRVLLPGSHSYYVATHYRWFRQPANVTMHRILEQTEAGLQNEAEGAGFVVFPYTATDS